MTQTSPPPTPLAAESRRSRAELAAAESPQWQDDALVATERVQFSVYESPTITDHGTGASAPKRTPRVLVVDDDADFRDLCARRLSLAGCQVLVAADGDSGARLATLTRPDLVLMDLVMPGTDGVEATRRLRGADGTRTLRIVGMTNYGRAWRDAARLAGCELVLFKTALIDTFEQVARALLRGTDGGSGGDEGRA